MHGIDQSKISNLHIQRVIQQYIVHFQIPMHNRMIVTVFNAAYELLKESPAGWFGKLNEKNLLLFRCTTFLPFHVSTRIQTDRPLDSIPIQ
jgi:hypothetical protein